MTVLTKASDLIKKADLNNAPLVVDTTGFDEESVKARPVRTRTRVWVYRSQCNCVLLFFTFIMGLVLLLGAFLGLVIFNDHYDNTLPRYKGYCSVPLPMEVAQASSQVQKSTASRMPLRFSSEPDVTLFAEEPQSEALNSLLERFEIEANVEKISVFNNGRNVEFIHDFDTNNSGIVDTQRCFVMTLDPSAVLPPGVFVLHIERGAAFDVSRVRRRLRALLPAAAGDSAPHHLGRVLSEKCSGRPIYSLESHDDDNIIRKRSADEPARDYMHFSGNNVQEISIDNMAELLAQERHAA